MKKENRKCCVKEECHSRKLLSGIYNACCLRKGTEKTCVEDPRLQASGMTPNLNNIPSRGLRSFPDCNLPGRRLPAGGRGEQRFGFTLIEMLVVVLIIGILAAVALPQYQRAVEKAAAAEALPILDAVGQAAHVYYLTHGDYPNKFKDLDVTLPWTGTEKWRRSMTVDTISNDKWSLQIYKEKGWSPAVYLGRISGKYAGTGFVRSMVINQKQCAEKTSDGYVFNGNPGDYCVKLFHAKTPPSTYPNGRYYAMP